MFVQGETSSSVNGAAQSHDELRAPAPQREGKSFSDLSGQIPDPTLIERQRRLRRLVGWVMVGAVGLLAIAGLCGLVRRSDSDTSKANVSMPNMPPPSVSVASASIGMAPEVVESPPVAAAETREPEAAPAAAPDPRPAPLSRAHRPKAAPRKARNPAAGRSP